MDCSYRSGVGHPYEANLVHLRLDGPEKDGVCDLQLPYLQAVWNHRYNGPYSFEPDCKTCRDLMLAAWTKWKDKLLYADAVGISG